LVLYLDWKAEVPQGRKHYLGIFGLKDTFKRTALASARQGREDKGPVRDALGAGDIKDGLGRPVERRDLQRFGISGALWGTAHSSLAPDLALAPTLQERKSKSRSKSARRKIPGARHYLS
jgi:hypothetical protein